MTRLARVLMALSAVVLMAQLSWAAEGVRVTAERVNLRSKPSTDGQIVAKVTKGTVLPVLGHEAGWVRVAAPGTGAPAYISAKLCEPAVIPGAPEATTPQPAAAAPPAESSFKASRGASSAEPRQFGGQLGFANESLGFGFGIRVSSGLPLPVSGIGVLGTFDVFLGSPSVADTAGVKVDTSGHSFQIGLFPTYSYAFGDIRVYAGAGLSMLHTSYSVEFEGLPKANGSKTFTSLGLVTGAKFKDRFVGEVRYQFGDGKHLAVAAGVLFNSPW